MPGGNRTRLTPKCVSPAASPSRRHDRPLHGASNGAGYRVPEPWGAVEMSILGIVIFPYHDRPDHQHTSSHAKPPASPRPLLIESAEGWEILRSRPHSRDIIALKRGC